MKSEDTKIGSDYAKITKCAVRRLNRHNINILLCAIIIVRWRRLKGSIWFDLSAVNTIKNKHDIKNVCVT